MKRWLGMLAAAVLVIGLPKGQSVDLSELNPVSVLYIYKEDGECVVMTDTGDTGRGATLPQCLEDLHRTGERRIFLDTAEYLLVTEEMRDCIGELKTILRPSTAVVTVEGEIWMENISGYLDSRDMPVNLRDYLVSGVSLPVLVNKMGRYYIE